MFNSEDQPQVNPTFDLILHHAQPIRHAKLDLIDHSLMQARSGITILL